MARSERTLVALLSAGALVSTTAGCGFLLNHAGSAGAIVNAGVGANKCEKLRKQMPNVKEETALGGAVALNWVAAGGGLVVDDGGPATRLEVYVNEVGKNLAAQSSRPDLDWTFGVLQSDVVNAYSTPGGYVFVTRGLLKMLDNESQLAGVLAHEISHVTERHALHVYTSVKANTCEVAVAASAGSEFAEYSGAFNSSLGSSSGFLDLDAGGGKLLGKLTEKVVSDITNKGFSHGDEYDADRLGATLMMNAGYAPKEYVKFLMKIPAGGGAFKNHPSAEDRKQKLLAWRQETKAATQNDPFSVDPDSKDLKVVPLGPEVAFVKK